MEKEKPHTITATSILVTIAVLAIVLAAVGSVGLAAGGQPQQKPMTVQPGGFDPFGLRTLSVGRPMADGARNGRVSLFNGSGARHRRPIHVPPRKRPRSPFRPGFGGPHGRS